MQTIASEQAAAEDEVRQKPDLSKDPLAMEEAMEQLRPGFTRRRVSIMRQFSSLY